jgi:endonuclease YncB( thermonuclease family)
MTPDQTLQLENADASVPQFSLMGQNVSAKLIDCYDGDTFRAALFLGGSLYQFSCRMRGYDTPEIAPPLNFPNREKEKAAAIKAKQALLSWLITGPIPLNVPITNKQLDDLVSKNKKIITLSCKEFDKYGRILVDVVVNGTNVNKWMVDSNYGYTYNGGTRASWTIDATGNLITLNAK